MKIVIETGTPRNDDLGDWYVDHERTWHIVVHHKLRKDSAIAVAIHEIVEKYLCDKAGVSDHVVTQFDAQFERELDSGKHALMDEPGSDPRSPYKTQHEAATFAERAYCGSIEMSWAEHEANCMKCYVD